jgi:hypothetical protein
MKRDAVESMCSQMNGRKGPKAKPVKARTPKGLQTILPPLDYDGLLGELGIVTEAVKKAQRHGLPLSSVPQLLKG